jgi:hypothetical protein
LIRELIALEGVLLLYFDAYDPNRMFLFWRVHSQLLKYACRHLLK